MEKVVERWTSFYSRLGQPTPEIPEPAAVLAWPFPIVIVPDLSVGELAPGIPSDFTDGLSSPRWEKGRSYVIWTEWPLESRYSVQREDSDLFVEQRREGSGTRRSIETLVGPIPNPGRSEGRLIEFQEGLILFRFLLEQNVRGGVPVICSGSHWEEPGKVPLLYERAGALIARRQPTQARFDGARQCNVHLSA